jgi:ankyrin repeat protein
MGCRPSISKASVLPENGRQVQISHDVYNGQSALQPNSQPLAAIDTNFPPVKVNTVVPLNDANDDVIFTPQRVFNPPGNKLGTVHPAALTDAPRKTAATTASHDISEMDRGSHVADSTGLLFRDVVSSTKNIHAAIKRGDMDAVASILSSGENVNAIGMWNSTPLITASQYNKPDIVKMLLGQTGVNVNHVNEKGASALLYSCSEGLTEIVSLLLTLGADPDPPHVQSFYNPTTDKSGPCSPLSVACVNGHQEIVKMLDAAGCDVNKRFAFPLAKTIQPAKKAGAAGDGTVGVSVGAASGGVTGITPLLLACFHGRSAAVRELMQTDTATDSSGHAVADPLVTDDEGSTALHHAVKAGKLAAEVLAELKLHLTADVRATLMCSVDARGDTALHLAVRQRLDGAVRLLLEMGADPLAKDAMGQSSVDIATKLKGAAAKTIQALLQSTVVDDVGLGILGETAENVAKPGAATTPKEAAAVTDLAIKEEEGTNTADIIADIMPTSRTEVG